MIKMKTLFKKDKSQRCVIDELDPENAWVLTHGIASRKYDGTACAIIDGQLYRRFDLKKGRTLPPNSIPCQEADEFTGHHPHWTKCERSDNVNKWHFVAFDSMDDIQDGTYELCGEKVQGNPENIQGHQLIPHGADILDIDLSSLSFDSLRAYLTIANIEGIVFKHKEDGRMCKLRKSDFGIKRRSK